jgi:hypothetical protein
MLAHMSSGKKTDIEDASQWLTCYHGKRHDASFTLDCDAPGIP